MRFGFGPTPILLISIVAGFGYLLYGYIDTKGELKVATRDASQLEQENQKLREQVDNANAEIVNLKAQVDELNQQVLFWQEQARYFEGQSNVLAEQNAALTAQNQGLEARNKELEGQINVTSSLNPLKSRLPASTQNVWRVGLLIPTLPVAIVATYVVTRRKTMNSTRKNHGTRLDIIQEGNMCRLSGDEMKEVINIRRGLGR